MITKDIFRIEAPSALFLVSEDPDQDLVEGKRPLCVVVLSLGRSASVIDSPLDRDRVVFDIRPLEAQGFTWAHTCAEQEAPEVNIPLVSEFIHEAAGFVRLKDFLAFFLCVSGDS